MPQLGPLPWVVSFVMGVLPFMMVLVLSCSEGDNLSVESSIEGSVKKTEW